MAESVPFGALLHRRVGATRLRWRDVPIWALGLVVVALWAAPFLWMVSTSSKPPDEVDADDRMAAAHRDPR